MGGGEDLHSLLIHIPPTPLLGPAPPLPCPLRSQVSLCGEGIGVCVFVSVWVQACPCERKLGGVCVCVWVCFRAEQIQRNPFGFLSLRAGARGLLCNCWAQTPLVSSLGQTPRLQRNPRWGTVTCLLSPNLEAHPSSHRGHHLGFSCVWVLERTLALCGSVAWNGE